jgi:hypothetical protein
MNTKELIKKHERAIELLEAINEFDRRIKLNQESLNLFPGTFPKLRKELNHRIEIQNMARERLFMLYLNHWMNGN